MSAGNSMSQKRTTVQIVALLLLAVAFSATTFSQSGQVMPPPVFTAYDGNGDPCSGCKLYVYLAGTTTPTDTYTTAAIDTANANPVVLDSAGRATVFLDPTISHKFVLKTAADVDIWTVDNVGGPFEGVVSVTADDSRGIQISRSSQEAGLSIASSGGSGKTYGIASTTTGSLVIRDDADGTPNITINASNQIALTATGGVPITGNLSVTGTITGNSYATGSGQVGFLAYNSVSDTLVEDGATVDFDTEVYDTGSHFASDTFTAPSTGIYHLCATVQFTSLTQEDELGLDIVTSNRTYSINDLSGAGFQSRSVCVYADMDASDTAFVRAQYGLGAVGTTATVVGGSPLVSFFSGRLVP